jgi:hypothetical protein
VRLVRTVGKVATGREKKSLKATVYLDGSYKPPDAPKKEGGGNQIGRGRVYLENTLWGILRRAKRLISPIRVYILIVCFFWFLLDAIEEIIIEFRKGFE